MRSIATLPTLPRQRKAYAPFTRPTLRRRALALGQGAAAALVLLMTLLALGGGQPGEATYLAAGASARAAERYDRALTWYAAASAAAPSDPAPRCLAGAVLALQQLWKQAAAEDQQCIARDVSDGKAWLQLGEVLASDGDTSGAMRAWERAARLGAQDAYRELGLLAERVGQLDSAQVAWGSLSPDDDEAVTHLGLLALSAGDMRAARADFQRVIARGRESGHDSYVSQFWPFVTQPPSTSLAYGLLGYQFLAADMPYLAQKPLREAVARDATDAQARLYLGWDEWLTHQQSAARRDIAASAPQVPWLSFSWFARGELAAADGQPQEALRFLQRGLALDTRNPVLWEEAGRMALAAHDYFHADLDLANAARLSSDPAYTEAFLHLYADNHYGFTDGRALYVANLEVSRWSNTSEIQFLVGEIYSQLDMSDAAYLAYTRARQLDPANPHPYVPLGQIAAGEGQYVVAALDFRIAIALQPNSPTADQARKLLAPIASLPV